MSTLLHAYETLAQQIKREFETQTAKIGHFVNAVVRLNPIASSGVNRHIVILIASAMHLSWAGALLFEPLHTTGIQLVLDLSFGSHIIAAILCAAVSLAAVAALFCRNLTLFVFLVLPQQFLLIASAIGAIYCVIDGKFADGAVYPRPFIFVDQIYLVLLCVAHGWQTVALWRQREFAERRQ
jgi:hypothetical protein